MGQLIGDSEVERFAELGFVIVRSAFEPGPLSDEVSRALDDGSWSHGRRTGGTGNAFTYVPMMCARTPVSLALIDALAAPAAELLERAALPLRAKGTRYCGDTAWHRD